MSEVRQSSLAIQSINSQRLDDVGRPIDMINETYADNKTCKSNSRIA